jgi:hypothetical protein
MYLHVGSSVNVSSPTNFLRMGRMSSLDSAARDTSVGGGGLSKGKKQMIRKHFVSLNTKN